MKTRCSSILKAALALALCFILLFGTMTVGIAAIRDELAASGYYTTGGTWFFHSNINGWTYPSMTVNSSNNTEHYYILYLKGSSTDSNIEYKIKEGDSGYGNDGYFCADNNTDYYVGTTGKWCYYWGENSSGQSFLINRKDLGTDDSVWYKVKVWFQHNYNNNNPEKLYTWIEKSTLSALTVSKNPDSELNTAERYQMYNLDDYYSTANAEGTVTYSYSLIGPDGNSANSEIVGTKYWTPKQTGTYLMTVTANDGAVVNGTNAQSARTASNATPYEIVVSGANYYFSSYEIKSGSAEADRWATLNEYKMKDLGNGSYSLDVSLTNNYEFIIKSDGNSGITFQGTVDSDDSKFGMNTSTNTCSTVTPWNSTYDGKYGRHFQWTGSGGTYTITFTPGSTSLSIGSAHSSGLYLTGRLNNHDIATRSGNLKFTETAAGSHVYTLTTSFSATDAGGGYQYATISKYDGTVYYPSKADADSGCSVNASTSSEPVSGTQKWKILAGAGKTVTFTLTCNASDVPQSLSWTIVEATVYAKDGAAPSDTKAEVDSGDDGAIDDGDNTAYYNYADIASTTITSKNGVSLASHSTQNVGASSSQYEKLNVEVGDKLVITTTIDEPYKTKYYVKAFNINGKSYNIIDASQANTSAGVYTLNYEVPSDLSTTAIEITPVYYMIPSALPNAPGSTEKVTLITYYLQGFDTSLGWGDTPYAYPFYGNYSSIANSFGAYPGQPFINEGGIYSTEIPLYNLPVDTSVLVDAEGTILLSNSSAASRISAYNKELIKGVVVSNGYYDAVHKSINIWGDDEKDHKQTYDSDGFFKVYNEQVDKNGKKPSAIYQQLKYIPSNKTNNRATYGTAIPVDDDGDEDDTAQTWGYTNNTPVLSYTSETGKTAATWLSDVNSGNGWELYTDYYGRPIDIFGNVIGNTYSSSIEAANPAIRVISTGYSSNISGDYGTAWLIYLPSGTETSGSGSTILATGGYNLLTDDLDGDGTDEATRYGMPPSVLAIRDEDHFTDTYPETNQRTVEYKENSSVAASVTYSDQVGNYETMWQELKAHYTQRYVYVSYESSQQKTHKSGTTNGAYRIDSRWAYSFETDMVKTDIEIQYWDSSTSSWRDDTPEDGNTGTDSGCSAYFTNNEFINQMTTGDQLINKFNLSFTAVPGESGGTHYMFDSWWVKGENEPLTKKEATFTRSNGANTTLVARFMPVTDGNLIIKNKATVEGIAETKVRAVIKNGATTVYDSAFVADQVKLGASFDSPYISNAYADYDIEVTLSTKPLALNTFSGFDYDDFTKGFGKTSGTLDGATTSKYTFKVGALFSDDTQNVKSITETSNVAVCVNTGSYKFVYKDRFGEEQTITSTIYLNKAGADFSNPDIEGDVTVYGKTSSESFSSIDEALASRAPSSSTVNVYQKTLNFSLDKTDSFDTDTYGELGDGYTSLAKNAKYNGTEIVIYAQETVTSYDFTYIVNGIPETISDCKYGEAVSIDLNKVPAKNGDVPFLGWSTVSGDQNYIISNYRNFGRIITSNTTVYAIYGAMPTGTTWKANIDLIDAYRNGETASLDILCGFTNPNRDAAIPDGAEMGVIFISASSDLPTSTYDETYCRSLTNSLLGLSLDSGMSGLIQTSPRVIATVYTFNKDVDLNNYNRVHQILNATYSKVTSTNFAAFSYIKVGETLSVSTPVWYGTFTGGPTTIGG